MSSTYVMIVFSLNSRIVGVFVSPPNDIITPSWSTCRPGGGVSTSPDDHYMTRVFTSSRPRHLKTYILGLGT